MKTKVDNAQQTARKFFAIPGRPSRAKSVRRLTSLLRRIYKRGLLDGALHTSFDGRNYVMNRSRWV
jgi:hypothetical protein